MLHYLFFSVCWRIRNVQIYNISSDLLYLRQYHSNTCSENLFPTHSFEHIRENSTKGNASLRFHPLGYTN